MRGNRVVGARADEVTLENGQEVGSDTAAVPIDDSGDATLLVT